MNTVTDYETDVLVENENVNKDENEKTDKNENENGNIIKPKYFQEALSVFSTPFVSTVSSLPLTTSPPQSLPLSLSLTLAGDSNQTTFDMENVPIESALTENILGNLNENILENLNSLSSILGRRRRRRRLFNAGDPAPYLHNLNVNVTSWNVKDPPKTLPLYTPTRSCLRNLLWFEIIENNVAELTNLKKHGFVVSHLLPSR